MQHRDGERKTLHDSTEFKKHHFTNPALLKVLEVNVQLEEANNTKENTRNNIRPTIYKKRETQNSPHTHLHTHT